MPEAPDLQVIKEFLEPRLLNLEIRAAREVRPLVLRNLSGEPFEEDLPGRRTTALRRRGKLLFFELTGGRLLVVNPMLTGGLRYCGASERMAASTHAVLTYEDGYDLRYFDTRRMGMLYYLASAGQLAQVPRVEDAGPDVLDDPLSPEQFRTGLKKFRGEIKGVLTRGSLVSGVGNAYADEILFEARIFPYKKRAQLSDDEIQRLYDAVCRVPHEALATLRQRVGVDIHKKVRDFLVVHGKRGESCPACGYPITSITANQRETSFCRKCQPGLLIRN